MRRAHSLFYNPIRDMKSPTNLGESEYTEGIEEIEEMEEDIEKL